MQSVGEAVMIGYDKWFAGVSAPLREAMAKEQARVQSLLHEPERALGALSRPLPRGVYKAPRNRDWEVCAAFDMVRLHATFGQWQERVRGLLEDVIDAQDLMITEPSKGLECLIEGRLAQIEKLLKEIL